MWRCLALAQGSIPERYSYLAIWDDLRKHILKDRATGGFLYTTMLSNRTTPVANGDGNPSRRDSLFGTADSTDLSNRYVFCLLSIGYRWKDSTTSYLEEIRNLANQGIAPAQAEFAMQWRSYGQGAGRFDNNEFSSWTRKAAEQGYAVAQYNLGQAYALGDGVAKNEELAILWMTRAAENGYARARPILEMSDQARQELKRLREDNKGLDVELASADRGDPKAQFILATRYEDGRGVDRDMTKAFEWYRKSAEGGLADAQTYLGIIYDKGRGIKQDEVEAARWYLKAAEQGNTQAQYNLAVFYRYGHGVERSPEEAKRWFQKARDLGHAGATAALRDLTDRK